MTTHRFKVGDRVKVTRRLAGCRTDLFVGRCGTVCRVEDDYTTWPYEIYGITKHSTVWAGDDDLSPADAPAERDLVPLVRMLVEAAWQLHEAIDSELDNEATVVARASDPESRMGRGQIAVEAAMSEARRICPEAFEEGGGA